MTQVAKIAFNDSADVPFQPASLEIWESKYRLKDHDGNPIDRTIDDTYQRVARALADVETERQEHWYNEFLWALRNGAVPAGRVTSNAGAGKYKHAVSLINCTVSATIRDDMDSILKRLRDAGITLKYGCGIGYEFSTLRHSGAFVAGAGASTSGPLRFMDTYDVSCKTISSAGDRRGAQMGTFDVSHPDIYKFIAAKRENGVLRQFNLSLLASDAFVQAVENDTTWELVFPIKKDRMAVGHYPLGVVYKDWPYVDDDHVIREDGKVACEVVSRVQARDLWSTMMTSTYNYSEPGILFIDRINQMNNNWWCEDIRASNPCGEQPLPPNGACLLGSVNLIKFVLDPFLSTVRFDWAKFIKVVRIFTRMLDNVVEISGLPLPEQVAELLHKRRHGMGYLGLGSAKAMLGMTYGGAESVAFTEEVTKVLAVEGWRVGLELAKEKGPAPIMDEEFEVTAKMLRQRPEMGADGYEVGDAIPGRILHARYSRYMQRIAEVEPELVEALTNHGCRFTHHSSIAPTGTISFSLGNNGSNGIEPSFGHHYLRNVIVAGKKTKEQVNVFSFELLAYRHFINPEAMPQDLPAHCVTADDIEPLGHIRVMAAAQKWIDSSISKTVNVPTDTPMEEFQGLYMAAYEMGLKGCTTYRYNPEAFQGVLVNEEDLKSTTYLFELENGETVELRGDQRVVYDGEEHVAGNLFDAIKEGTYGRY